MARLDPQLRYLRQQAPGDIQSVATQERIGVPVEFLGAPDPEIRILAKFTGDIRIAQNAGMRVTSIVGDIAAGFVRQSSLGNLEELSMLETIESSRPMHTELNVSRAEINAHVPFASGVSASGNGVIVAIIDSGIDFEHPAFWTMQPDGTRKTRILAIWDQHLTPVAGETSPIPYGHGVEYSQAQINNALNGLGTIRHIDHDASGHGTHVAGIAAGSASGAAAGMVSGHYTGIAPDADILVVANRSGKNIGTSANTLDAVNYLLAFASRVGKCIVINQSQGDNLGAHDGTSLLEQGIDKALGAPGQCMVKSAGNAGDQAIHAQGTVSAPIAQSVEFVVPSFDVTDDVFDLWYDGAATFSVELMSPSGARSSVVSPGSSVSMAMVNGNQVFIDSALALPANGDNQIFIQLQPGTLGHIESGKWTIVLAPLPHSVSGRFDVWIGRDSVMPSFVAPHVTIDGTITVPGTAKEVITVGAYVTSASATGVASAAVGALSVFSSRGPSRDGRSLPTLCAPGEYVTSAKARAPGVFHAMRGTSMAAPHVTGAIARLFERCAMCTQRDIVAALQASAKTDASTGTPPTSEWGSGKLNARDARTHMPTCP